MSLKELKREIFLKKGKLRRNVLKSLDKPKTATEVSKELGRHRSSISRVLIELQKKGLVKVINPEDDRFRHYVKNIKF